MARADSKNKIARLLIASLLLPSTDQILFAQSQETVFRASSRLVQVTVLVHDKHGQPVRDLTQDDFSLFDNGKQQGVSFFEKQIVEPTMAGAPPQAGQLTITNRPASSAKSATGVTIILFDSLNSSAITEIQTAKLEMVKFLKTLQPTDPVALYSLAGPQLRIIHDFTEDTRLLIESAEQVNAASTFATRAADGPALTGYFQAMGEMMQQAARADMAELVDLRRHYTLAALEDIAHHVASIPGRKSLVWISSSFPVSFGLSPEFMASEKNERTRDLQANYTAELNRVAKLLTDVEVAVYPVDPKGLSIDSRYSPERPDAGVLREINSPRMITEGEKRFPSFRTMDLLAEGTGGKAYYNKNYVGAGIKEALDDGRVTYVLGFHPDESAWDGRFHNLVVKVNRPGVEVRSRKGYFASSKLTESEPARDYALQVAVFSPFDGSSIGLKANVTSNPLGLGLQLMELNVDARDIRFVQREGRWQADADFVFVQMTADGGLLRGQNDASHWNLSAQNYATAMAEGLKFPRVVTILPQAVRLKIVVRDPSTGAVGSLSVPVKAAAKGT